MLLIMLIFRRLGLTIDPGQGVGLHIHIGLETGLDHGVYLRPGKVK